jgi:hypothetical protein
MKNLFDCCNSALSMKLFHKAPRLRAGMKFNLNEDGSKYMRFIMEPNLARSSQMNPGTMIEESQLTGTDIGNRRCAF